MLRTLSVTAALLLLASQAFAAPQFIAKQGNTERTESSILGASIQNPTGEKIGDVNHLVVGDDRKS